MSEWSQILLLFLVVSGREAERRLIGSNSESVSCADRGDAARASPSSNVSLPNSYTWYNMLDPRIVILARDPPAD